MTTAPPDTPFDRLRVRLLVRCRWLLAGLLASAMGVVAASAGTYEIHPATVSTDEKFETRANALQPGDELILHGGVYSQEGRRAIRVKGTPEAPIVIRAALGQAEGGSLRQTQGEAPGESPLLTRPATPGQRENNIEFVDCEHLVIRGLRFQGGNSGVRFIRGHHIRFEDCEIFDTQNNALTMNSGNCHAFILRRNHIHHTGLSTSGPTEGEGMYIGCHDGSCRTTDSLIESNYIHHLRGTSSGGNDGIEIKLGSHGNIIRNNVVHDTNLGRQYPGIFVYGGGPGTNLVEGNLIWNAGEGIQVVSDAVVRNNIGAFAAHGQKQNPLASNPRASVMGKWLNTTSSTTQPHSPPWLPSAPSLPPPGARIVRVATPDALLAAVERSEPETTILLADGDYQVPRVIVLQNKRSLTLRSASGDPAKVTLRGRGWESDAKNDDILHIGRCEDIIIAELTFSDCRSYGIKVEAENGPKSIQIYHCRFRDIGVRALKGSAGQVPEVRAVKGSVRYCTFENTKVPPSDWLYGGDYISAIDMMALEDWTFSDNYFRNIKGRNGGGRAAIFVWVRSHRVVVERNLIMDCDRGIAFGNPGQSTANRAGEQLAYVSDSVIRNNCIVGGADCGIELWHVQGIDVWHNTVWRPERNWSRGIRIGTGTARTRVMNNLVHGEIRLEGGDAQVEHNLAAHLDGYFVDVASGDMALTSSARGAIAQGIALPQVPEDIVGKPRTNPSDLGAWQSDVRTGSGK